MITNPNDKDNTLYVIATALQQTYQHLKKLDGKKHGYHLTHAEYLLKPSDDAIKILNHDKDAESLFYGSLKNLPVNDLTDHFDIVQLQIKGGEKTKKSAVYCFCPNAYVRELTRQLYNLFSCAAELLSDDEPQKIIEIMAHHYCYAYQQYLNAPLGTFNENTWSFQGDPSIQKKIRETYCVAQTILSHAIHDLLIILQQYDREAPIWIKIFSSLHQKSLYNQLMKAYHEANALEKEVNFYFFDIDYCSEKALQTAPFLPLFPIDPAAVQQGANSAVYQEVLSFLDNPYKRIKNSVSSELSNELQAVVSQEKQSVHSSADRPHLANPWPYSYVPIPFEDFMLIEKKLNIRLNAITGDDAGVEPLPDVIQRITKRLKNPNDVQIHIAGKHNAHLQLENSTSLDLATQYVEIEHDSFVEKFPALTLNAELGSESDPLICMQQMINLAIESHNPYFYIIGDEKNLELTKKFLVEALSVVKNNPDVKFYPQIIGLPSETIARISKAACDQAGYPAQTFLSGLAE